MDSIIQLLGFIGIGLLGLNYYLNLSNHIKYNDHTYLLFNILGLSFILYNFVYFGMNLLVMLVCFAIFITFNSLLKNDRRKSDNKIGNKNAQYENLRDDHFLKYFNNFDIDYNVGTEFRKIFDFNLAASSQIPFFVRLFENPKYEWFLPWIFRGRVDLQKHDFTHLLLSRGFNIVDEIAVVGITMGSTKKMNSINTFLFYILQWLFYDKYFRFPLKYYPIFARYVKLGNELKKNLSKIKVEDWFDYQMSDLRKEFGLFKEDLIEIWKVEVLEFGVNNRMLEGLTITSKEQAVIEEVSKEIFVYSDELLNDLLDTKIISAVSYNLNRGTTYKWVCPRNEITEKRREELLELHKNNKNMSIILIDEEAYYSKHQKGVECVYYDNLIYVTGNEDGTFLVHTI